MKINNTNNQFDDCGRRFQLLANRSEDALFTDACIVFGKNEKDITNEDDKILLIFQYVFHIVITVTPAADVAINKMLFTTALGFLVDRYEQKISEKFAKFVELSNKNLYEFMTAKYRA